ncbi:MAG: T9SS type A sorting domain-containing protein [Chitinophagaceae bacterium]
MKQTLLLVALAVASAASSFAQTTARNFTQTDCGGTSRNLYTDLDGGNIVIMEWYMGPSCQPCKDAAKEIEALKTELLASHPGKIISYTWGFQDSYTCAATSSWLSDVGSTAIGMDTGAALVAYYGGFSMPTIVVAEGTDHKILWSANPNNGGYSNGDTSKIRAAINGFYSPTAVSNVASNIGAATVFPSPTQSNTTIQVQLNTTSTVQTQILNIAGQVVLQLPAEKTNGIYTKVISTDGFAAGMYTVRIVADGEVITRKLSVIK